MGTPVERKSRYLMLVKLRDGLSEARLEGFTRKLCHASFTMKESLTYDQGRGMAYHEILVKRVKIDVYFDPHSPGCGRPARTSTASSASVFPRGWIWRRSPKATSTQLPDS